MPAVTLDELYPSCLPFPPQDMRMTCVCEFASQPEPWILLAVGLALLGAVAFGYAVGRVRRIRAKVR